MIGITSSNGTAAAAAAPSNWETFMSRELSDADVAALRSGKAAWGEAPEGADPSDGLWKRAK
jgi:hypothetical protein